jgi:hypothetical protein
MLAVTEIQRYYPLLENRKNHYRIQELATGSYPEPVLSNHIASIV